MLKISIVNIKKNTRNNKKVKDDKKIIEIIKMIILFAEDFSYRKSRTDIKKPGRKSGSLFLLLFFLLFFNL